MSGLEPTYERTLRETLLGVISLHRNPETGVLYAVKRSKRKTSYELENPEQEANILRSLGAHPHIVEVKNIVISDAEVHLSMEYLPSEMFSVIERDGPYPIEKARQYFVDLVSAVRFLHGEGIAHMDLSLENILLSPEGVLKIVDFGAARRVGTSGVLTALGSPAGKRGYMSPEVYAQAEVDCFKADVWSLGVILCTMLVGAPPYETPNRSDKRFVMVSSGRLGDLLRSWNRLDSVPADALQLLNLMFAPQERRSTIQDVWEHKWLAPALAPVSTPTPTPLTLSSPSTASDSVPPSASSLFSPSEASSASQSVLSYNSPPVSTSDLSSTSSSSSSSISSSSALVDRVQTDENTNVSDEKKRSSSTSSSASASLASSPPAPEKKETSPSSFLKFWRRNRVDAPTTAPVSTPLHDSKEGKKTSQEKKKLTPASSSASYAAVSSTAATDPQTLAQIPEDKPRPQESVLRRLFLRVFACFGVQER